MRQVAAALVHYPVLDRSGRVVTTAITNLDLHDLGRSGHAYGLSGVWVVHPVAAQRELAVRVREHWISGSGGRRIPDRRPAMQMLRVVPSLQDVLAEMEVEAGTEMWSTGASARHSRLLSYSVARAQLSQPGPPVLLLFGTGWGLANEVLASSGAQLEPIRSRRADGYNHLSVRAAAAITFDRLLGVA
ncbi:RNA methyltransferase [Myxococcota bacterium]